jgi:hypothetical protein
MIRKSHDTPPPPSNLITQPMWVEMWVEIKKSPEGRMNKRGLAEAVRFELTEDSHPRRFSRPVHSTALPSFRVEIQENIVIGLH